MDVVFECEIIGAMLIAPMHLVTARQPRQVIRPDQPVTMAITDYVLADRDLLPVA